MKHLRILAAALLSYAVVLYPNAAIAAEMVCRQGAGNAQTIPWYVQTTPPSPGSSTLATWSPTATSTTINANGTPCTAASGASCTIILASTEIISWSNFSLTIRNSGANAITNVLVEFSPDNTNWEVWDSTTFAGLAASAILSMQFSGNSRRYIRVEARSASGSSSVVNLNLNDG